MTDYAVLPRTIRNSHGSGCGTCRNLDWSPAVIRGRRGRLPEVDGQTRGMPLRDAPHNRAIVGVLRWGREQAEFIRQTLPKLIAPAARTGSKLVTILRGSPLTKLELPTGRYHSFGRSVDSG